MSRGQQGGSGRSLGLTFLAVIVFCLLIVGFFLLLAGLSEAGFRVFAYGVGLLAVAGFLLWLILWLEKRSAEGERQRQDELKRRAEAEQNRQDERKRHRIESLLRRDAVGDEINYMSGVEFERFMADLFRQKGYGVEETKATGDQGVDLLLDVDGKRVAVQLKRWTAPVGNAVVGATFAGMAHYDADEGWIITTSTFTRSAKELAKSTRVRLIDGKELGEWLEGLREE